VQGFFWGTEAGAAIKLRCVALRSSSGNAIEHAYEGYKNAAPAEEIKKICKCINAC